MAELNDPVDLLNATIKHVESASLKSTGSGSLKSAPAKSSPPPLPSRVQGPFNDRRLRSGHSCETFGGAKMSLAASPAPIGGGGGGGGSGGAQGRMAGADALKTSRSHEQIFHSAEVPLATKKTPASAYQTPPSQVKPVLLVPESAALVGRASNNYQELPNRVGGAAPASAAPTNPATQEAAGAHKGAQPVCSCSLRLLRYTSAKSIE